MPARRNQTSLAVAAVFALLNVFVFIRDGLLDSRPRIDFYAFYEPSAKLRAGLSPFPEGEVSKTAGYIYPQAWAFVLEPLTVLPRDTAARVWRSISLCLLLFVIVASARFGIRAGGATNRTDRDFVWAIAICAGIGFTPALFGWNIGQFDILLAAVLTLILIAPQRHRAVCAGICVGVTTLLKVSPVLLVPALAMTFGFRFIAAFASVVAAYMVALLATGTFGRELELFTRIMPQIEFNTGHPDSSIYRLFLADWFGGRFLKPDGSYGGITAHLMEGAILVLYASACWLLRTKRAGWMPFFAVGIAFSHLASPFIEPHHFTNTLLILVPWTALFVLRRDWLPVGLLGVIWFIGFNFQGWHSTAGAGWPGYTLFITDLVLLAVAFVRPQAFAMEDEPRSYAMIAPLSPVDAMPAMKRL